MVVILMGSLYVGAKIVTLPFFSPELYIKSLVAYKPTALYVVPPMGKKIVLQMYWVVTRVSFSELYVNESCGQRGVLEECSHNHVWSCSFGTTG